jgi:hypothetical protein
MLRRLVAVLSLATLLGSGAALAQERKAYKYVDEKGNVTYSQTPPATGKDASKIDITPANSARGGNAPPSYSYPSGYSYSHDAHRYEDAARERARRAQDEKARRLAALEDECTRARGTDCKNPETLRYIESQKIPGTSRRR